MKPQKPLLERQSAISPARPSGFARQLLKAFLPPLIMGGVLFCLYVFVRGNLEPHRQFLMPGVSDLWSQAFGIAAVREELLERSITTMSIALAGLGISIPTGIFLGIIMFRFYVMERAVFPYLVALQSIPIMAIIPLIQSALGFGFFPKVLIVALFTFFAIPTTLLLGLKSVDRGIIDLFRLQGASWFVMLRKAGLPSAAPALFAGLRISGSLAVIAAIVSELFFLSGRGGLGQMLMNTKIDFKYEQMYAALIVASILSICVYVFFNWLGNRLFSQWHESARRNK
ncbi:ABC transporter permease [Agrobacterium sp. Azo12]|jgi:NitT/TauT family transport system permease protein|uniref:ABC transporter permease n=1 Tax=Agrobacterium sp. Azo12 TaxID=3031129 RepID=UPI0023D7C472|nr:ABC transporter permease [Agrobacterium sp. Azo12]MDO5897801.1 ABC transporter permease [Agrobacterium sp. Azo12]